LAALIGDALPVQVAVGDETRPKPVDCGPFFQVDESIQESCFTIVKLPPE
jgi:hypothetical protein